MNDVSSRARQGNEFVQPIDNASFGRGLLARRDLSTNQFIFSFADATAVAVMDIYSIQVARNKHVRHWIVDHLNHSCDSNVRLDTTNRSIVATRHIKAGEELTFFYPSTEWQMFRPFPCGCAKPHCIGVVAGAKSLPWAVLNRYQLTDHIIELHREAHEIVELS